MINLNIEPLYSLDKISINVDLPEIEFKHISVESAMNMVPKDIGNIIKTMDSYITNRKKYQNVFVKVEYPGKIKGVTGLWHLDSALNGEHFYENYLYVTGVHPTEFVEKQLSIESAISASDFDMKIKKLNPATMNIDSSRIYKFREFNVHRGPLINEDINPRVLIRLSNTDVKHTPYRK